MVFCLCAWFATTSQAQYGGNQDLQQTNRWQLGVEVQNTNTGIAVTYVQPGSPAANVGLVPGDRILTVAGYQVGYVDGRLSDLGDLINRNVGSSGQVNFLVLSSRGGLQAMPVTFFSSGGGYYPPSGGYVPSGSGVVDCTVVFQGGQPRLSTQAVLNARMIDVSYDNWNNVVVAQTAVPLMTSGPMRFQMTFNPRQVYDGHRYAMVAEVVDQGRAVYRTEKPFEFALNPGKVVVSLRPTVTATAGSQGPNNYAQIAQWYQTYLGRQPTQQEAYSWQNHLDSGRPASDIQYYLLGSTEFYDRHQNNDNYYLSNVYQSIYGSEPSQQQLYSMRQQYDQLTGARSQFIRQMANQRPL